MGPLRRSSGRVVCRGPLYKMTDDPLLIIYPRELITNILTNVLVLVSTDGRPELLAQAPSNPVPNPGPSSAGPISRSTGLAYCLSGKPVGRTKG